MRNRYPMYQFTEQDLQDFAEAWVTRNCVDSPGSENSQIMKERIYKELIRVFEEANEPIEENK